RIWRADSRRTDATGLRPALDLGGLAGCGPDSVLRGPRMDSRFSVAAVRGYGTAAGALVCGLDFTVGRVSVAARPARCDFLSAAHAGGVARRTGGGLV